MLTKGYKLHLNELGYFHVTLKPKGAAEEKGINPNLIEKARVRFVAGSVLEKKKSRTPKSKRPPSQRKMPQQQKQEHKTPKSNGWFMRREAGYLAL